MKQRWLGRLDALQCALNRLGALPARKVTWGLVLIFSLWVALDVLVFRVSTGLAQSNYDAMVRARFNVAEPDPRLLIVDIDEASLIRMAKDFGRWPWPRDTLATVLDFVEKQQPVAIAWDIVFSDPDRLSPGGDAAFNESARRSVHSHFPVVRLPSANDASSQITALQLPGLWLPGAASTATVALIAPVLPAVAAAKLGFNNGYPDADGILRRYRQSETISDGSVIQSMALAVQRSVNPRAGAANTAAGHKNGELIVWRKTPNAYPRVSFSDLFELADGGIPSKAVPSMRGKIVVIGSTAPSLHDIHPTPLSPLQAGVESLATAIDNAVNQRELAELPRPVQALLAVFLCAGIAVWVQFKSVSSLTPALVPLPVALLGIGYLSLNGFPVFLDLHLAAGFALIFLATLRFWAALRRNYWCGFSRFKIQDRSSLLVIHSPAPWSDSMQERLMDIVERHAPECRIIAPDANPSWPHELRLPVITCFVAVVGPMSQLSLVREAVRRFPSLRRTEAGPCIELPADCGHAQLVHTTFMAWADMMKTVKTL